MRTKYSNDALRTHLGLGLFLLHTQLLYVLVSGGVSTGSKRKHGLRAPVESRAPGGAKVKFFY